MGECFELTLFAKQPEDSMPIKKHMLSLLDVDEGKNQLREHRFPLLANKDVFFEVYPEFDFVEYCVAITELYFTKKNFDAKMGQILEVVATCFDNIHQMMFATGVYELTYDYIKSVKRASDFNKQVLSKFPLLFFREGNEYGFTSTRKHDNISYIVQSGVNIQVVFANPYRELMEDYGMSFEEAANLIGQLQDK